MVSTFGLGLRLDSWGLGRADFRVTEVFVIPSSMLTTPLATAVGGVQVPANHVFPPSTLILEPLGTYSSYTPSQFGEIREE